MRLLTLSFAYLVACVVGWSLLYVPYLMSPSIDVNSGLETLPAVIAIGVVITAPWAGPLVVVAELRRPPNPLLFATWGAIIGVGLFWLRNRADFAELSVTDTVLQIGAPIGGALLYWVIAYRALLPRILAKPTK